MEDQRINKYLSVIGFCSRREADRLIEAGRVKVNGRIVSCGERVNNNDDIEIDGRHPKVENEKILIAFNKPKGISCTTFERDKSNIISYINYPKRIYPIGRLDKDSEGLILLTNQGELVNRILRGSNFHEKEYKVLVNKPITPEFLQKMSDGVNIGDAVTRRCIIKRTGLNSFDIILTQGLNRQIRRMCEALDYRVRSLQRVRIMNIKLDGIELGKYRNLTDKETKNLNDLLKNSNRLE